MSEYTPQCWVRIKIEDGDETLYKIVGGWSGGYLDGDHWRVNSGITNTIDKGDYYEFYGHSGSMYTCYKDREYVMASISGVLSQLCAKDGVTRAEGGYNGAE